MTWYDTSFLQKLFTLLYTSDVGSGLVLQYNKY